MRARSVLRARLEIVTPVFCAGADQNGPAEMRPFSIRGALRWWYRAIDRNYAQCEEKFFGAAGEKIRSSPVALRVKRWVSGNESYASQLNPKAAMGRGDAYLGYTLYLGSNKRKAIPDRTPVEIELIEQQRAEQVRRAWAASLWLFGHLGGLGTRSRRGFGTMALTAWSGWPECKELPPVHGASTAEAWKQGFDKGFKVIRSWFAAPEAAEHHHLGSTVDIRIWQRGYANWRDALHTAGTEFHQFRQERKNHDPARLAAFGLPLAFTRSRRDQIVPEGFDRAPSRIQFRVVHIAGKYHPLVWRARGPLMPRAVKLKWKRDGSQVQYAGDHLIDLFLQHIAPKCLP